MYTKTLNKVFKKVGSSISKHSPEILTGIGIAGMVTTTVLAVKSTPKALLLIEKEKNRINRKYIDDANKNGNDHCQQISKLKAIDIIKTTWKCYIPSAILGASSIACLIGASSVHLKRNAVLATAYKLSESALTEYKDKVVEVIGEKKEEIVRDKINKDHVDNNPVSKSEVIITEKGNTLCYDHISGRYFKSDIDKIKKAINEINKKILHESYVSLNEFYDEIGLSNISIGYNLGWNSDMGLVDIHYSSQLADDGTPCLVIDYDTPPKYDFDKFC